MPKETAKSSSRSGKKGSIHKSPKPPRRQNSAAGQPVFGQPQPSRDPSGFKNPVTDQGDPQLGNLEAVPQPRGGAVEPVLTLAQVYGNAGAAKTQAIQQAGQIVF